MSEEVTAYDVVSAERGLVAVLCQYPVRVGEVRRRLPGGQCFESSVYGLLYAELLAFVDAGGVVDLVTLTERLRERGSLEEVGGPGLVAEMWTEMLVESMVQHYADLVWRRWQVRQVRAAALQVAAAADAFGREGEEDLAAFVGRSETLMFERVREVQAGQGQGTGLVSSDESITEWAEHLEMVIKNRGKIVGLTTGIHELDQTFHGLDDSQGEILVVAGRPGMGKTAFGISIESHFIDQGFPGLVISAEMSRTQWNTRLVLGSIGMDTSKAITGHFGRGEIQDVMRRAAEVRAAPRMINGDSYVTTADLRMQAQVAKRTLGVRWMLVDHLTLIKPVTSQGIKEERLGIKETMEALQWIKKELKIVVVLLVQMSRESDRNVGKQPVMADLAGSAAIEQYADHILFLYRPSYYVPWHKLTESAREAWIEATERRRVRSPDLWAVPGRYDEEDGGVARHDYEEDAILFVRKNRRGPTPEVHVRFQPERTWYSTRMPALNSNNVLDQQFGSYTVAKKSRASDEGEVKPRRRRKGDVEMDAEDMDEIFG